MSILVLGIRIDTHTRETALQQAALWLGGGGQHTIFTPNPEMLVAAKKDPYFREVLNQGSLNLCDGRGIELVSRGQVTRIPGIEYMFDVCTLSAQKGTKVYLLGSGSIDTVEKTKNVLLKKFPTLHIVGVHPGLSIQQSASRIEYTAEENEKILADIRKESPAVLFVAFGHGKQEKWISENMKRLPSVRIAMGVGGAFDTVSGRYPRAPKLLRHVGLEWLWRLCIQPWRIVRIWNATVRFLYLCVTQK